MRFAEVEPGVFLGCHQAAKKPDLMGKMASILNCCEVCFDQRFPTSKGLHINFVDGKSEWNDEHMLEKAARFIQTAPRPIFVHCWSGQSRSAAVLAYALSKNVAEFDMKVKRFRAIVNSDGKFPPGFTNWVRAWKEHGNG